MIKTRTWVILIAAVLLFGGIFSVFSMTKKATSHIVEITVDGAYYDRIDLSAVTEGYSFTIEDEDGGTNVITVEPGRICVSEADCPDLICVQHGWLPDENAPIVCMPHRLMLRMVENDTGTDVIAR